MRYRQLVDDQRVRFVDDTSSRVFSSCARLIALAPVGETEDARVVVVMTLRECIAEQGRRAAAARERMLDLVAA